MLQSRPLIKFSIIFNVEVNEQWFNLGTGFVANTDFDISLLNFSTIDFFSNLGLLELLDFIFIPIGLILIGLLSETLHKAPVIAGSSRVSQKSQNKQNKAGKDLGWGQLTDINNVLRDFAFSRNDTRLDENDHRLPHNNDIITPLIFFFF